MNENVLNPYLKANSANFSFSPYSEIQITDIEWEDETSVATIYFQAGKNYDYARVLVNVLNIPLTSSQNYIQIENLEKYVEFKNKFDF
ncbi:MAG: hypothetical protein LBQ59_01710 [Candidatus Peribacteria bacterium]|nr:hypothetical protein [Candidatus Peribacteria bacterium]